MEEEGQREGIIGGREAVILGVPQAAKIKHLKELPSSYHEDGPYLGVVK